MIGDGGTAVPNLFRKRRRMMKTGMMIAALLMILVSFSGVGMADTIVKGKVILISGISNDTYTIKTESNQGFDGSRETFYVDPKSTKKTGEIKVGTTVEAEVNINGTANWVKSLDEAPKAGAPKSEAASKSVAPKSEAPKPEAKP
jgi:hypothetical protein